MVRRAYQQRSLVGVILPDADKLSDLTLREIHRVLEDEALIDRVAEALAQRYPSRPASRCLIPHLGPISWVISPPESS